MSESIAPFVSSTPPPFDEDFKFEDEEDLDDYKDAPYVNYIQEKDKVIIPHGTERADYILENSEKRFEEFQIYQSTSDVDLTINNMKQCDLSLNQFEFEEIDEFEEFVSHENDADPHMKKNPEVNLNVEGTTGVNQGKIDDIKACILGENSRNKVRNDFELNDEAFCDQDHKEGATHIDLYNVTAPSDMKVKDTPGLTFAKDDDFEDFVVHQETNVSDEINDSAMFDPISMTHSNCDANKDGSKVNASNEVTDTKAEDIFNSTLAEDDDFEDFAIHKDANDNVAHEINESAMSQSTSTTNSNWTDHDFEDFVDSEISKASVGNCIKADIGKEETTNLALNDQTVVAGLLQGSSMLDSIDDKKSPSDVILQQQPAESYVEESWADFGSIPEISSPPFLPEVRPDDSFPTKVQECHGDDADDEDFGGFEGATDDVKPSYDAGDVLNQTFNLQTKTTSSRVPQLLDLIDTKKEANSENSWSRIWKDLELIERTPALNMKWKTSSLFQHFLKSLDISQQSIITSRNSNVPIFATNLCLLEPTKALDVGESRGSREDGNQAPTNDVPNVEFDWANSVLMNPLDVGNVCHLDLDFFGDEVFTSTLSPACKKEKELLESLEPAANGPRKPLSINSFLASVTSKSNNSNNNTTTTSTKDRTDRAMMPPQLEAILEKIPDLSFMQSRVLMFPVREEFVAVEGYS